MINESTKLEGALFTVRKDKRRPNGPLMEGQFQIEGESGKIQAAAWVKASTPKDGKPSVQYYSIQLELSRENKLYGALFPATEKKAANYPDYYGTLNLGREQGSPELRIAGWKRKTNADGTPFISVVIEPARPQGNEESSASQHYNDADSDADLPI